MDGLRIGDVGASGSYEKAQKPPDHKNDFFEILMAKMRRNGQDLRDFKEYRERLKK